MDILAREFALDKVIYIGLDIHTGLVRQLQSGRLSCCAGSFPTRPLLNGELRLCCISSSKVPDQRGCASSAEWTDSKLRVTASHIHPCSQPRHHHVWSNAIPDPGELQGLGGDEHDTNLRYRTSLYYKAVVIPGQAYMNHTANIGIFAGAKRVYMTRCKFTEVTERKSFVENCWWPWPVDNLRCSALSDASPTLYTTSQLPLHRSEWILVEIEGLF